MNLDYLFKNQILLNFPLQREKIDKKYYVTISSVKTGETQALNSSRFQGHDFLKLLRASCSAPLYTRNTEEIDGAVYNDGHIGMAIPYQPLLDEPVDYIFCLMTQPKGYAKKDSFFSNVHQKLALSHYPSEFRKGFQKSHALYNQQLEYINHHAKLIPIQIESQDFLISKMCTDAREVDRCRASVKNRMQKIFNDKV